MVANPYPQSRWVRMSRPFFWRVALAAVLSPVFCSGAADSLEYNVKAAFLLNFTKFIEWPPTAFADSTAPIAICILGDDPFGSALDQIVNGETVNGRKVVLHRTKQVPGQNFCQVLFVSKPDKD